jgi:hydroxymethylbilane synthase
MKLGTRGSALALWQAHWTKTELERHFAGLSVELIPIKTTGDKILDVPLAKIGGKGLFTRELDEALLDKRIDIAVHSLKDIPFQLTDGTELAAIPEREDSRDAFLSNGPLLQDLPAGATIGTSSLRRQVQIRHRFPSLNLAMLRGNVDTRLRKLENREFDGIILALAGLKRLGHESRVTQILDDDVMISAVGQGALGIVCRQNDRTTKDRLATLDHSYTRAEVTAERALLRALGGSCQTPVGGRAQFSGNRLQLKAFVASLDGTRTLQLQTEGPASDADALGYELGKRLLEAGGAQILAEIQSDGSVR